MEPCPESGLLKNTSYKFIKLFKKGKQGIVGLVYDEKEKVKKVFKISQHIDYVVEHEETVATRLQDLKCPFFLQFLGSETMLCNPKNKCNNPWENCTRPVKRKVIFYEYVKGHSLSAAIRKQKISIDQILQVVKIVLLTIYFAYFHLKFTHYDLHTSNILLRQCDPSKKYLFVFDKDNQFFVPTMGWEPVIIDYGFSYIDSIDEGPMYQSLAHTNVGFCSCAPDPWSDTKLFLASVSSMVDEYCTGRARAGQFRHLVKNIFEPLDMDFHSGWDITNSTSIANEVLDHLHDVNRNRKGVYSTLFNRYDHYAVDIMTSLVILPLNIENNASYSSLKKGLQNIS